MAQKLVESYGQDQAWEQWYDVEMLENYHWNEAVIAENLRGRNCKRLRGMDVDAELFSLASHAMAFKLTEGDKVLNFVQDLYTAQMGQLSQKMNADIERLMTHGLKHSFDEQEEQDASKIA